MKDSGIEWIGEIPEDWNLHPVYNYFEERKLKNTLGKERNLLSLSYGNIVRKNIDTVGGLLPASFNTYNIIESGDIIIRPTDLQNDKRSLRTGLCKEHGIITSAYIALKPKKDVNSNYYHYLLHAYDIEKVFYNMGNGVRQGLNYSEFAKLILLSPPPETQKRIADFLDEKCDKIDGLKNDIQKQIETLEQYKKSVITEAVTKGINPNAKMKDSGIDDVEKIPESWEEKKIKFLFDLVNEQNHLPMDKVQLLSLYTELGVFPHGEQEERGNKAVTVEGYKKVKKNDLVVNIILAWMGAMGISNYDGVTSPAYDIYRPKSENANPKYYHYLFRTPWFAGECDKYGRGIMRMRWRTYSQEFMNIKIPYPSAEEQKQIADYLDKKCSSIDSIISTKKQQLERLEEYKKSLIFEYVTGKRRSSL